MSTALLGWLLLAGVPADDLTLGLRASGLDPSDRPRIEAILKSTDRRGGSSESTEPPSDVDPHRLGRQLLADLHAPRGPLRRYDERATTLAEILDSGRFNCVSATALYLLAAERLGIDARAELLPTHARARVWSAARKVWVVVETTAPEGYDPDPSALASITARVSPLTPDARSLVGAQGLQVELRSLWGAMYANRGSLAAADGELERAEELFAHSERLVDDPQMRAVLRAQRASLLGQLASARLLAADEPAASLRARDLLLTAVELEVQDPVLTGTLRRNLRAVSEAIVSRALTEGRPEAARLALERAVPGVGPELGAGLKAFFRSERARLHIEAGELGPGIELLESALALPLGPEDEPLRLAAAGNLESARRALAERMAADGRLDEALEQVARLDAGPVGPTTAARLAQLAGHHAFRANRLELAATRFRSCREAGASSAPACTSALLATLQRRAAALVRAGRCDRLAEVLKEIEALEPGLDGVEGARRACRSSTAP